MERCESLSFAGVNDDQVKLFIPAATVITGTWNDQRIRKFVL